MRSKSAVKKVFVVISSGLLLTAFAFFLYTLITGRFSLATNYAWDGVSVASTFSSGNGSEDNPYIIRTPEEFVYFKSLIEGEQYSSYYDKFYVLDSDLDFGGNSISAIGLEVEEDNRYFRGSFDGQGHTVQNLNINQYQEIDNVYFYGLFSKTMNAIIQNVNFDGLSIVPEETDKPVSIGLLVGDSVVLDEEGSSSTIGNISIQSFTLDMRGLTSLEVQANLLMNSIGKDVSVSNIYVKGMIFDSLEREVSFSNLFDGEVSNILYDLDYNHLIAPSLDEVSPLYVVFDQTVYFSDEEVSHEDICSSFNQFIDGKYYWNYEEGLFIISIYEAPSIEILDINKSFSFSILRSTDIALHDSGIDGDTVYINDLDSDYNYYMGQNYTNFRDLGTLPTGVSRGLYTSSNLVKVYMMYDGSDINDSSIVGYVSLDEQVSKFVYYKYYSVTNGYVEIELLDNPYADRPNGKYFQGWATDYVGAEISYDSDVYVRSIKIPVNSSEINITLHAVWGNGTYYLMNTNTNWTNAVNALESVGMIPIGSYTSMVQPSIYDYYISGSVTNRRYPTGAVNNSGNTLSGFCFGTCSYYILNTAAYNSNTTYYELTDTGMQVFNNFVVQDMYVDVIPNGDSPAGYFKEVSVARGNSMVGYYSDTGVLQTGDCNTNGGCTVYELMQFYTSGDTPNVADGETIYYYLVTRDTNIVVLSANSTNYSLANSKPMTVTGINNNTQYNGSYTINNTYIRPTADLRIEYIRLDCNATKYTNQSYVPTGTGNSCNIYGNWQNVKIGRGLTHSTDYLNAFMIMGGSNGSTGTQNSLTKYRLIVESGYYNFGAVANGGINRNNPTAYVDGVSIWGSDFDRIQDMNRTTIPNPDKLDVYYAIAGNWGGALYSSSQTTGIALHTIVKSGVFGSSQADNTTGVYVGGRYYGTHYAARELLIEGGDIYNVIGGPMSYSNRSNLNDIYIDMKGGTVYQITAGAGTSATYGHRIISVTGGHVLYSVFGGSNGSDGTDGDGTINGSSFVYIGGNAIIGDDDLIEAESTLFGAESGSVFGIGNGRRGYDSIGAMKSSNIVIDGNAQIKQNVYGGGNFGYVGTSDPTSSTIQVLNGHIYGSVYGGGNNNGSGTDSITSTVSITVSGGMIDGSVYGGSRTKGTIFGATNVTINGGTIATDVYGGGEGGYDDSNAPGTYVRDNVVVTVNDGLIQGSVYGGSAYGTVNAINETTTTSSATTTVTVNDGVIQNSVFGGGKGSDDYTPKVVGDITVAIEDGSIGKVFGGFDASGNPSAGDVVYLNGGEIGNAFGGGNNANQTATDIRLQGATITGNLYGGSNLLGTVTTSNVSVTSGSVTDVFGGNNLDGLTVTTNVSVTGGEIYGDIYGGGNEAASTTSNVTVSGSTLEVNDVYGGGKEAGLTTSHVDILSGATCNNVFGGSNVDGVVEESHVTVNASSCTTVYGGNNQGGSTNTTNVEIIQSTIPSVFGGGDNATSGESNVLITSGTITNLYGGGNEAGLTTSNVTIVDGTITNVFGGSNQSGDITTSNLVIGTTSSTSVSIDNLYGGNNLGGVTSSANITAITGTIDTIYGGGNEATVGSCDVALSNVTSSSIYGGGNAANVTGNVLLDVDDCTISGNLYGGGNEGVVQGNTTVYVTDSTILGNAFAGGNGSTAVVYGNSTITVDGSTVIGSPLSIAPNSGCVFGSGNAASTGIEGVDSSIAKVNIVGGTIYGNVYGGPKMAVVYGVTETNIGSAAVNINGLDEDSLTIYGTVFGGGESNASGSSTYDWNFVSVTNGISVTIDGSNYLSNSHDFILNGSIFGSGNASTSAGESNLLIKNLGTASSPNRNISIQRATNVVIDSSVIELSGTVDTTNEFSDIVYSFNIIDKLVIKNGTTLLLQHNANMLKEFYSGVDVDGELVPAVVDIDDEEQTVTKNVDNRLYMIPGENLNVTINQAATVYGKVTGMTFFGMYTSGGSYRYGLYDSSLSYGDSGNASLEIVGGSYVKGLHSANHDITKDGFYSNYLDEDTYTEIITAYIDPTPIGTTGYRWNIGFEAINYEFTLTAAMFSSLGTYELQLEDFDNGDSIFTVLGFDSSGLNSGLSLVDSANVPRVGSTEQEANSIFGLSMKTETQEWMAYGTTKMLSADDGSFSGTQEYMTDSRQLAPSLMFYLYHAKNLSMQGPMGSVIVTMQSAVPKNAIDYDIKFLTITINLTAVNVDSDSYDAAITYDKKYELPSTTMVNITNQSQFSTYYSLTSFKDRFESVYGNNNENFHVLVTNYALPVNTMITMLDYGTNSSRPEYYYFRVTQANYDQAILQLSQYNEITYRLDQFVKMNSTSPNNTYDDASANLLYYDSSTGLVDEEFMFIFDFKECTSVVGDHLNNTMLFELRNSEDRTVFSVYGQREEAMVYSTYESSNVVLNQVFEDNDSYLYYNNPDEFTYSTQIQYNQTQNNQSVIDTNYESSSMGLNVTFLDRQGEVVSSSMLLGTTFHINNRDYSADGDGVFRIKLAGKVSNLVRDVSLTANSDLPAGEYTIRYTLFASDDGLHNSSVGNSVTRDFTVHVVSADNSIVVECDDSTKLVFGETGLNYAGTRINSYHVTYSAQVNNPNFRIEIFKRDLTDIQTTGFTSVAFSSLFADNLMTASDNEVYFDMESETEKTFQFTLGQTLTSGTYRIAFRLYDNNQLIDEEWKYVIVQKNIQ